MSQRIRPKTNPSPPEPRPPRTGITDDPEGDARLELYVRAKEIWGKPGFTVWIDAKQEAAIQLLVEANAEIESCGYEAAESGERDYE